jgi:UDP-sulfoquinovose synthase
MRIIILGGDGYLGWPTAMHFAARNHAVLAIDNYLRRRLAAETQAQPLLPTLPLAARIDCFAAASGKRIAHRILDCTDSDALAAAVADFAPDAVVHYAEQPSAPYSMMGEAEARLTLHNNLFSTFAVIWAVKRAAPRCHIIKLGSMGEYGTPDIAIEEGSIEIEHKGRKDRFLFPRAAGSFYHTTKILDTDLLAFEARASGLRVTDLMQGPVYGHATDEAAGDPMLMPHFHYDDLFGTVLNRFVVQAVAGVPLTVYGSGAQMRGYIDLRDTVRCIELVALDPPAAGTLRIFNQFTELFAVRDLAERVARVGRATGLAVAVGAIPNPRPEREEHYYRPAHDGLLKLGLVPHLLSDARLAEMIGFVARHRERIDPRKILPRVSWSRREAGP